MTMADEGFRVSDEAECRLIGQTAEEAALWALQEDPAAAFVGCLDHIPRMIFGVCPTDDPAIGAPWMLATPSVRAGLHYVKEWGPIWVDWMHRSYPRLENHVSDENHIAKAFLDFLGFKFAEIPHPTLPVRLFFRGA